MRRDYACDVYFSTVPLCIGGALISQAAFRGAGGGDARRGWGWGGAAGVLEAVRLRIEMTGSWPAFPQRSAAASFPAGA